MLFGFGDREVLGIGLGFHPCVTGGSGGGVLRLTVGGTLDLGGQIAADGWSGATRKLCTEEHAGAGGGAGGSLWIGSESTKGSPWLL